MKQEAALGRLAGGAAEVGHVAGLQALHQAGLRPLPEAEFRIARAETLMQQVRDLPIDGRENTKVATKIDWVL